MNKTITLIIPVLLSAVAMAMLPAQACAADHSWPHLYSAQVSFIIGDGFSAGPDDKRHLRTVQMGP